MANATIKQVTILEDNGAVLLARVRGTDGTYITQASITSIAAHSYDLNSNTGVAVNSTVPVVASTVFDSLQTSDARWTEDVTGYNFAYAMPAAAFPEPGHYQVEIVFNAASGDDFTIAWKVHALEMFTT